MDIGSWGFKGEGRRGLELPSGSQVGVAPSGRARFRYNETLGIIEFSVDEGAFTDISAGSGSGWTESTGVVSLVAGTDQVVIGGSTPAGGEKLLVVGDTVLEGGLSQTGDFDTSGTVSVGTMLDVTGTASLNGGLSTQGPVDIDGGITDDITIAGQDVAINSINTTMSANTISVGIGTTALGFFGVTPAVQPATPVNLADVITALQTLGLVA